MCNDIGRVPLSLASRMSQLMCENSLLVNQRDSVGIGINWGGGWRGVELDGYAHWVLERGEGCVVIHTRGIEGEEEVNESVVYEFF